MLILTSNGLTTPDLIQKASPFLKGKRCALVTTASVGFKEKDWHVPRLAEELFSCGAASVELFDFDLQSPEAFSAYDAALLIGGNPFYLLASIRKHGFADVLNIFGKDKTLIGVSAGSLVLTPSIGIIMQYTPEMNDIVGLTDLSALHLYPRQLLPHYGKFLTKFDHFEQKAQTYEQKHGIRLIRLNDGEAIFCETE